MTFPSTPYPIGRQRKQRLMEVKTISVLPVSYIRDLMSLCDNNNLLCGIQRPFTFRSNTTGQLQRNVLLRSRQLRQRSVHPQMSLSFGDGRRRPRQGVQIKRRAFQRDSPPSIRLESRDENRRRLRIRNELLRRGE